MSFPSYRLPLQADNLSEDIEFNRKRGGTGCLGVAKGTFRGKSEAVAVLLTKQNVDRTLLVIAYPTAGGWKTELLRNWGGPGRSRLYVESVEPGTYRRADSIDGPLTERGEVSQYTSASSGIVTGATEASGVAYFYTGKRWVHVWVSD